MFESRRTIISFIVTTILTIVLTSLTVIFGLGPEFWIILGLLVWIGYSLTVLINHLDDIQESVEKLVDELKEKGELVSGPRYIYERGTKIIRETNTELYIFEKTPAEFFGTRVRKSYEREYFRALTDFRKRLKKGKPLSFTQCVLLSRISEEFRGLRDREKQRAVLERIRKLARKMKKCEGSAYRLKKLKRPLFGSLILGDDCLAIELIKEPRQILYIRNQGIRDTFRTLIDGCLDESDFTLEELHEYLESKIIPA